MLVELSMSEHVREMSMEMERTASCSCGQLSVTVRGAPAMQGICSCLECQRQTGSSFFHHGYWPKSAVVRTQGLSTPWRRIAESGRWIDNHFCPVCGSSVFGFAELDRDSICVSIGSFADASYPAPEYSIWERHKHAWIRTPDGCQTMDTQP
jgi:hypothetical protein